MVSSSPLGSSLVNTCSFIDRIRINLNHVHLITMDFAKELFTRSSVDGSLAMDQNTCMDESDGSHSDDSRDLIDLNCYTQPKETLGEDL
ncbi:hypothetical protein GUJ93_ZPchr0006g42408 [Zizania palustris]|uniref:Uncharacterized protein n=1 Tax=Zizania palustris TaxID=103762 RepID=A0A8J5VGV3_ZIZPA|nr:hypothetical protein GUJ93_ZPchr0006g42408 [Zizania palustris]